MEVLRAKLLGLSVYKNMLEVEPVQALLRLTEAKTPDALIRAYTDIIYSVWSGGFETLSDCISWHLKYDESFIGFAVASGKAPERMLDAAAMDIRRLSAISMLSFPKLKEKLHKVALQKNQELGPVVQTLAELPMGTAFTEEDIFESYRQKGCGQFALGRAFHWEKGRLTQVKDPDVMDPMEMIGYQFQRNAVMDNTRALLSGRPANNVLLYGDSGTGKSATVKSLIGISEFYNLRLIEISKNSLEELTTLIAMLARHTQKFIVYIDDLSFEAEDKGFSALKTALEGGLERRPDNVAIYVTSNRRHMVRESFSERQGDEVHAKETLEERTSLSERFGLRLAYLSLDKQRYQDMVLELCRRQNISMTDEEIRTEANRWELQHGGRTPRVAAQLVEKLAGQA